MQKSVQHVVLKFREKDGTMLWRPVSQEDNSGHPGGGCRRVVDKLRRRRGGSQEEEALENTDTRW